MTELDYEYLLRTLSDAHSRANEIAIAVRGRVGVEHRLSELGNSAVAQIETVLRDMRRAVAEESQSAHTPKRLSASDAATITPPGASPRSPVRSPAPASDPAAEHWFPAFVNELLERYRADGGITFETVENILQARKNAFVQDLLIARRMYRAYPHLFQEASSSPR